MWCLLLLLLVLVLVLVLVLWRQRQRQWQRQKDVHACGNWWWWMRQLCLHVLQLSHWGGKNLLQAVPPAAIKKKDFLRGAAA